METFVSACLLSYATEIVIDHCHGKRNCTLVADSKTFTNPCKEKSRVYLKVVYACGTYFGNYHSFEDHVRTAPSPYVIKLVLIICCSRTVLRMRGFKGVVLFFFSILQFRVKFYCKDTKKGRTKMNIRSKKSINTMF